MSKRQSSRVRLTCETCGNIFFRPPSEVARYGCKFCSNKCRYVPQNILTCNSCGIKYQKQNCEIKCSAKASKFCSVECSQSRVALLLSKINKNGHGGCWLWVGGRSAAGYGVLKSLGVNGDKSIIFAHRLSWEYHNQSTIPDGLFVCHKCDNPRCVNPTHLFIGTAKDNVYDMIQKGRHSWQARARMSVANQRDGENPARTSPVEVP